MGGTVESAIPEDIILTNCSSSKEQETKPTNGVSQRGDTQWAHNRQPNAVTICCQYHSLHVVGPMLTLMKEWCLCRCTVSMCMSVFPVSKEDQALHIGQLRWHNKQKMRQATRGSFLRNQQPRKTGKTGYGCFKWIMLTVQVTSQSRKMQCKLC